MSKTQWDFVTEVESDSELGVWHVIKRRRVDGHLGCDCKSYQFAKRMDKTCRHIRAYEATQHAHVDVVGGRRQPAKVNVDRTIHLGATVRVHLNGADYTVGRRAISFGGIR